MNMPAVGETIAGKYRIVAELGSGGFAQVYHAKQVEIGRDVALKVLKTSVVERSDDAADRFIREGRLVSELRNRHTVTLYDFGRTDTGLLFMAFEFVDGRSLEDLLLDEGPMAPERVVVLLLDLLESLEEAHDAGIVHRDLKPANIMVIDGPDGEEARLLDFGVAKPLADRRDVSRNITAAGATIGTPRYMSPEQIMGDVVDPRSDIYSLGLVAFEMLTNEAALDLHGGRTATFLAGVKPEPIVLPTGVGIPDGLREVVDRMCRKPTSERYMDAKTVALALAELPQQRFPSLRTEDFEQLAEDPLDRAPSALTQGGSSAAAADMGRPQEADWNHAASFGVPLQNQATAPVAKEGSDISALQFVVGLGLIGFLVFGIYLVLRTPQGEAVEFFGPSNADANLRWIADVDPIEFRSARSLNEVPKHARHVVLVDPVDFRPPDGTVYVMRKSWFLGPRATEYYGLAVEEQKVLTMVQAQFHASRVHDVAVRTTRSMPSRSRLPKRTR